MWEICGPHLYVVTFITLNQDSEEMKAVLPLQVLKVGQNTEKQSSISHGEPTWVKQHPLDETVAFARQKHQIKFTCYLCVNRLWLHFDTVLLLAVVHCPEKCLCTNRAVYK